MARNQSIPGSRFRMIPNRRRIRSPPGSQKPFDRPPCFLRPARRSGDAPNPALEARLDLAVRDDAGKPPYENRGNDILVLFCNLLHFDTSPPFRPSAEPVVCPAIRSTTATPKKIPKIAHGAIGRECVSRFRYNPPLGFSLWGSPRWTAEFEWTSSFFQPPELRNRP